jgi:hypothetical protein
VRLLDVFRTATFRTAAILTWAYAVSTLLLFLFIYWQTAVLEIARIDDFLLHESAAISREDPALIEADVATRYARDLHRQTFAAVFSPALKAVSGGVLTYPQNLPRDARVHRVMVVRDPSGIGPAEPFRTVARDLPDGRILLVGRSEQMITALRQQVLRALELGLLPGLVCSLALGIFASQRTLVRLSNLNATIGRITQGHLRDRLESAVDGDAFDELARGVNRMLDEIERLVSEISGVGDDIAHDLRTPLTRVRARLEGARNRGASHEELCATVDRAIADLDQTFALMTALLRIGQIEASARRAGFADVSLTAIAREVFELYQPVAELNDIALSLSVTPDLYVHGDRDLLFEVAANLVDNAVKFTPPGGVVQVAARQTPRGPVLCVQDSGPGIPKEERSAALQRFHRADRSRHVPGYGLGLSLVSAILRVHLFHLHMGDGSPGLVAEVRTWPVAA